MTRLGRILSDYRLLAPVLAASLLMLSGCGGGGGGSAPEAYAVAQVQLSSQARQLIVGEKFTITARTLDASGREIVGRSVQWSTGSGAVANVSPGGEVTAVNPGQTSITATSEGKTAAAQITVVPAPVATVELDAEEASLEEGVTRQFVATVRDAFGAQLLGRGLQWSTSDSGIASVDAVGRVTALRPGRVTVTVRVEGKTDDVVVLVATDNDFDLAYDAWNGVPGVGPELYLVDIRHPGGMPARLLPGRAASAPAPSPDGTRIAFVATVNGIPQIFVVNAYETDAVRLTNGTARDEQPTWSPDGSMIAFRRWTLVEGSGHADIWVMNADGSNSRSVTEDHGATNQTSPAWSPSPIGGAYRIVYSSQTNTPAGEAHLWSMLADGTDKRQLTSGAVFDGEPAWSPDGATIAFNRSGTDSYLGLQLMDASGTNIRGLLPFDLAFGQFTPAWSLDGKLIAFTSKHEDGQTYQIYTVWADGSKLARRTFDTTDKQNPKWIMRTP